MKIRYKKIILSLLVSGIASSSFGEVNLVNKRDLKFSVAGRILFDGALFGPHGDTFSNGVAMPDIRLGGKVEFGKFNAKIDIGYGMQKLSLKDVYMQYSPNKNHHIRLGYFVHPFGLSSATSSSMKPSFITPLSDDYFNAMSRNMGLMYIFDKGPWFMSASAFASGKNLSEYANTQGKISVGGLGRFVWRPYHERGKIMQIGVSPWYQTAAHERLEDGKISNGNFDFSCNYPTEVNDVSLLSADIDHAKGVFKITPELLLSKGRFALESQYYYMNVNRDKGFANYTAQGVYGMGRILILGDKEYTYSHSRACLATPKPKTLECVLGYNYTNANSREALINGGITNDFSVTFTYYINKWMLARLRYSYTDLWGSDNTPDQHVNIVQARIMFKF